MMFYIRLCILYDVLCMWYIIYRAIYIGESNVPLMRYSISSQSKRNVHIKKVITRRANRNTAEYAIAKRQYKTERQVKYKT